jgi:hypothetical protein
MSIAVDLDAVAIVPIDPAVDFFTVLEHDNHGSAARHLLLEIKSFGMGLLDTVGTPGDALLGTGKRSLAAGLRTPGHWQGRTDQFTVYKVVGLRRWFWRASDRCRISWIFHSTCFTNDSYVRTDLECQYAPKVTIEQDDSAGNFRKAGFKAV